MRYLRIITSVFLLSAFTLTTLSRPVTRDDDKQEETKLTAEEKREAREFIETFRKRFEETDDYTTLSKEFYVKDFLMRLRASDEDFVFTKISDELKTKMSDAEFLEMYFASSRFMYFSSLIYCSKLITKAESNKRSIEDEIEDEDEEDINLGEVIPPDVIALIEKNLYLSRAWADVIAESKGTKKETSDDDEEMNSHEELQSVTSFFKEAIPLMRKSLESQPEPHSWQGIMDKTHTIFQKNEEANNEDILNPHLTILRYEFFGMPEGTRLICVDLLPFHVDLIRVEGKLKVLHLYFAGD